MEKAKLRLNNTVSDWKRGWEEKGDEGKPPFLTGEVWNGLKNYWMLPKSQQTASKCSASRNTVGGDGLPQVMPHTSGQTPFAGRRLQMASGGELPPMTRVFEETHKKKDGSFVNARAETFHNVLQEKIAERQTQVSQQMSPGGSSVQSNAVLTTAQLDQIYEEVAPKKRGRVLGMGSIHDTPYASSSRPPGDDPVVLRTALDAANAKIAMMEGKHSRIDTLFEILAASNPEFAAALRAQQEDPQEQPQEQPPSTSAQPDAFEQHRRNVENSTDDDFLDSLDVS